MKTAKDNGCITTLDVFASTRDDLALIEPLLPYTDYFMPSEEEAMALSGLHDLDQIADYLLDKGTGCVILTLGEQGAMYHHHSGERFEIPAFDIDIICTCGCGDCFNAGFATGLHLGMTPKNCVRLAQASSAQNAMGLGSQAIVKDLATTLEFMHTTKNKIYTVNGRTYVKKGYYINKI